jgi:hypothetical protein
MATESVTAPAVPVPYFVKFLSGAETGRVILVTQNTDSSPTFTLTLDTTDNSTQTTSLTTNGFAVAVGDSFEVFAGDTLASVFGATTSSMTYTTPAVTLTVLTQSQLVAGTGVFTSDTVSVYSPSFSKFEIYFFNSNAGYWELKGSSANANNTIIYPYSATTITRRGNEPSIPIVVMGRVSEVPLLTKTTGSQTTVYGSTGFAADMTLSQLTPLGLTAGSSVFNADTIAAWDSSLNKFDIYYMDSTNVWREKGNTTTDQGSVTGIFTAGKVISITKRSAVSGQTSFLPSVLPYALQ